MCVYSYFMYCVYMYTYTHSHLSPSHLRYIIIETAFSKQIGADCIWSDPATEAQENPGSHHKHQSTLDTNGFGASPRGGGVVCFGNTAITNFLKRNDLSYIVRAHEAHAMGVAMSKAAR